MAKYIGTGWENGKLERTFCKKENCEFFHILQAKTGADFYYPQKDKGKCKKCLHVEIETISEQKKGEKNVILK